MNAVDLFEEAARGVGPFYPDTFDEAWAKVTEEGFLNAWRSELEFWMDFNNYSRAEAESHIAKCARQSMVAGYHGMSELDANRRFRPFGIFMFRFRDLMTDLDKSRAKRIAKKPRATKIKQPKKKKAKPVKKKPVRGLLL